MEASVNMFTVTVIQKHLALRLPHTEYHGETEAETHCV